MWGTRNQRWKMKTDAGGGPTTPLPGDRRCRRSGFWSDCSGPSAGEVNAEGNEVNVKVHGRERFRNVGSVLPGLPTGNAATCSNSTSRV